MKKRLGSDSTCQQDAMQRADETIVTGLLLSVGNGVIETGKFADVCFSS